MPDDFTISMNELILQGITPTMDEILDYVNRGFDLNEIQNATGTQKKTVEAHLRDLGDLGIDVEFNNPRFDAVESCVIGDPSISNRQIARTLGMSVETVADYRRKLNKG